MSTHRIAAAVLTSVILLCLTACGGDSDPESTPGSTPESTPESTDAPEPETFTISGTYAEQGREPRSAECVSGEDKITVKNSTNRSKVAIGTTSAHGKYDTQSKACLYNFILRKVPVNGYAYVIVVGNSEPRDFSRTNAEDLLITGTVP